MAGISISALQAELEQVIARLESDDIDIDQAAQLYEQGLKLIEELTKRLKQTENKITKLNAAFDA